jgi:DNA-directed RNA polymerase subunit RPC12/RpoP
VAKTRIHKAGVFFDCTECGKLLRDCTEHNPPNPAACPDCSATIRIVGIGNAMVQNAVWLRCLGCGKLWMRRRGEVVETRDRSGFERFT